MIEKEVLEGNYSDALKKFVFESRILKPNEEIILAEVLSIRTSKTSRILNNVIREFSEA